MPLSRRRKKKGKKIKYDGAQIKVDPNAESHVTLQDLINVLAYQEYVKDGTIVADDVKLHLPDVVPVTVEDEDGNKRQVGTASPTPGDDEHMSIQITDPEVAKQIQGPPGQYSIEDEKES